jgi:hypothetical protein
VKRGRLPNEPKPLPWEQAPRMDSTSMDHDDVLLKRIASPKELPWERAKRGRRERKRQRRLRNVAQKSRNSDQRNLTADG